MRNNYQYTCNLEILLAHVTVAYNETDDRLQEARS